MKNIDSEIAITDGQQNYTIQSEFGYGGFATVYKAVGDDGNSYAVKVMNAASHTNIKSFYNEFGIGSNFNFTHVINSNFLHKIRV